MKELINDAVIEGYIFKLDLLDQNGNVKHSDKNNMDFLSGSISVAQDDSCLNVIRVDIPYIAKFKKDGNENKTFKFLMNVIENQLTVESKGIEEAAKIKIQNAHLLGDEYFSDSNRDENGELVIASSQKVEAGFSIFEQKTLNEKVINRNLFSVDILIKDTQKIEGNDTTPSQLILHTFIGVNKKNKETNSYYTLLAPFDFVVEDVSGIAYFLSLGATPQKPVFTKIIGYVRNTEIKEEIKQEKEGVAFGVQIDIPIAPKSSNKREFVVINAKEFPYSLNNSETMTIEELKGLLDVREKINMSKKADKIKRIEESGSVSTDGMGAFNNSQNFVNDSDNLPFDTNDEVPSFDLSNL